MFFLDFSNTAINLGGRYDMSRFMKWKNDCYDSINSYFLNKISSLAPAGSITVNSEIDRIDLLSYKIYKSTEYWWILLLYNEIICPLDINIGDEILFPSLSDISNLYLSLKAESLNTYQDA